MFGTVRTFGMGIVCALLVSSNIHAAPPEPPEAIKKAIQGGLRYLAVVHRPNQIYRGGSNGIGTACLAGLAMLECGVKETDPSLRNIIFFVRRSALQQTRTYEISLCIMFLDRLDTVGDRHIIQFLGIRLLGGQLDSGGWTYDCGYPITPQDDVRLTGIFMKESRLIAHPGELLPKKDLPMGDVPRPDLPVDPSITKPEIKKTPIEDSNKLVTEFPALHPEAARFAKLVNVQNPKDFQRLGGQFGDNSNTQFGTLGLWCARKDGVPSEKAFEMLNARFRTTQGQDGGWGYGGAGSTPAMTCAGLLGLAASQGAMENVLKTKTDALHPAFGKQQPLKAEGEDAILNGLKALGNFITQVRGAPQGVINLARGGRGKVAADALSENLYFMWSLERVGVIYGLETIGNHDWYAWGSEALLAAQSPDGSWTGHGYPGADTELSTSFALLFLSRANVARDLSAKLKGKIHDPGVAILRGGDFHSAVRNPVPDHSDWSKNSQKTANSDKPSTDLAVPESVPISTGDRFEVDADRLANSLLNATDVTRPRIMQTLRDSKGGVYTEALARAIPKLSFSHQSQARSALAQRLTRMTAGTLRGMFKDENQEVRTAAISAAALKKELPLVPDLIDLLAGNSEPEVANARASLRQLSGSDFGPAPQATAGEKLKAMVDWRAWWKGQNR